MTLFRTLSVFRKILLGYGGLLVLIVVLAGFVYHGLDRTIESTRWVAHTQDVLLHTSLLGKLLVDMETGERGFIITGDEAFLEPYSLSRSAIVNTLGETQALIS